MWFFITSVLSEIQYQRYVISDIKTKKADLSKGRPEYNCTTSGCFKSKVSISADLIWSGRRGSNSRPQPWQGCALPTELLPRVFPEWDCKGTHFFITSKFFCKNFSKKCKISSFWAKKDDFWPDFTIFAIFNLFYFYKNLILWIRENSLAASLLC